MSATRLPTHLEVSLLIRRVESAGGFATVLQKGEPDSGSLLIVTMLRGGTATLHERMPRMDGRRTFEQTRVEDPENKELFSQYLARRRAQDRDSWLIELDIDAAERFVVELEDG